MYFSHIKEIYIYIFNFQEFLNSGKLNLLIYEKQKNKREFITKNYTAWFREGECGSHSQRRLHEKRETQGGPWKIQDVFSIMCDDGRYHKCQTEKTDSNIALQMDVFTRHLFKRNIWKGEQRCMSMLVHDFLFIST